MGKTKKLLTNWRVLFVLISVVLALVALHINPWAEGVAIRNVAINSSASIAGIESPKPNSLPMSRERINSLEIDQKKHTIKSYLDYLKVTSVLENDQVLTVYTNRNTYILRTLPITETLILDELENKTVPLTVETIEEKPKEFLVDKLKVTQQPGQSEMRAIIEAMYNDIDGVMPDDRKNEFYELYAPQMDRNGEMDKKERMML